MPEWTLKPGDLIKRTRLHKRFGGRRQGGIGPSCKSPNVFIFSDPTSGEQHGYVDKMRKDGCFHYTGEGRKGNQTMKQGNRAIRDSAIEGRVLRVFEGCKGWVRYRGQFTLDPAKPWYTRRARSTGNGPLRTVIIFRLRPVDALEKADHKSSAPSRVPSVESVAVEKRNAEKALVEPECESYEAQRRESQLVQRFKGFLEQQGHIVERLRITPVGEAKSIFTDVYVKNLNLLIEAKGTSDRIAIRMAIGQLMDYKRFVKPKTHCAVLVPMLPRNDLLKLLKYAGIAIYYPTAGGFTAHNNN